MTELIARLSHQEGRTVFLCTHNLNEAQHLCDRVAVMDRGRLLALGTQEELSRTLWSGLRAEIRLLGAAEGRGGRHAAPPAWRERHPVRVAPNGDERDRGGGHARRGGDAGPGGARILSVALRQPSLEEIYFAIRGEQAL